MKIRSSHFIPLLMLCIVSLPAWAHHGYPQYNMRERVPLHGTIMSFRMGNPHSHMTLEVTNESGETELWAIETTDTLRGMRAMGFTPSSLQPGDVVTIMASPATNGDHTAVFQSVEFEDGRILPEPGN